MPDEIRRNEKLIMLTYVLEIFLCHRFITPEGIEKWGYPHLQAETEEKDSVLEVR
jgi:hypothetical protein